MKIVKKTFIAIFYFSLTSCQFGYYFSSAKNQFSMMNSRLPVEKVLESSTLTEEQKNKITLSQKARLFAFEKLLLKSADINNKQREPFLKDISQYLV